MSIPLSFNNLSDSQQAAALSLFADGNISTVDLERIKQSLPQVWLGSLFVEQKCQHYTEAFLELVQSGYLFRAYNADELNACIQSRLSSVQNETGLMRSLRLLRQREMLRIIWRDLSAWSSLPETMSELSELADACVGVALNYVYHWSCAVYGTPYSEQGEQQHLVVMAMGKLGGQELNLSSDIDLIFSYPQEGKTQGNKSISNHEFFQKLGQKLINVLSKLTEDGFVFRVDMRLRPFGDGPIAISFNAMEDYYQIHGRDWERYAMIKARIIAGDKQQGETLLMRLRPFVYRRYVDYSAFESIREMKAMIQKEVLLKNKESNIKVGAGGIREIEFIGQVFQLIRGGRELDLQSRSILAVLGTLQKSAVLPEYVVAHLLAAYDFLRRTEHRLQAWRDEQTHSLPDDEAGQIRLSRSMGFDNWSDFSAQLSQHRTRVHEYFDQVFVAPHSDTPSEDTTALMPVWSGLVAKDEGIELLIETGFKKAEDVWRHVSTLRKSRAYRNLSKRSHERMDRLMPLLLSACSTNEQTDLAFIRTLQVIEAVMQRSVYLVLLVENPLALSQFVRLCSASPWISRYLSLHPLLLDDLLDVPQLFNPAKLDALKQELAKRMVDVAGDEEQSMDRLRQFKQSNFLKVAAADIFGALPLPEVSNHLSWVAEAVMEHTLNLAWAFLVEKHGRPVCTHAGEVCDTGFAVIAYGKLGGYELGYGSDLDMVFLHSGESESLETTGEKPVPLGVFFVRLGQRIMHILGAMTPAGVLFEVDMRLRPDGAAGMLVSSLKSFADYQAKKAWTWEHQALVRARVVAGDPAIARQFQIIRRTILSQKRNLDELRTSVLDMRDKMHKSINKMAEKSGKFDLKHSKGGIVDIEFMVQYGVLAFGHQYESLLVWTDNSRLLAALSQAGVMSEADALFLSEAYQRYRNRVHRLKLQELAAIVPAAEFERESRGVQQIWSSWLKT